MITLDIESEAIEDGVPLLPKPVGIALRWPDGHKVYLAFGHPTENNCTWEHAGTVLQSIWDRDILTHNGGSFDIPVLQHWFQLPPKDPLTVHDTLFLAYLHNPHARSLSLKDLAADWLGMPKDEQAALHDWIVRNVPECRTRKQAGAYICKAPGKLVGDYAMADVEMTYRLFMHLQSVLETMQEPYDRERRLAPILADMQNRGIRCNTPVLEADTRLYVNRLHQLDEEVRRTLKAPNLNPGSNPELGAALEAAGYNNFLTTPKGARSVAKDSLDQALDANPGLRQMLKERHTLATLTGTFMQPWLDYAAKTGGSLHPSYNQVRNPEGFGTRTGRLSSSKPNFQNLPTDLGPEFPMMRSYILPDKGCMWSCADFKSQEPRIAAHFEDGMLLAAYLEDPMLDQYLWIGDLCSVNRKESKTIFLGLLYTMGIAALAEKLECDSQRATTLRNIIRAALPDIQALDQDCKRRFKMGLPIRTLGGRLYYCEPPSNNRTWDYKALNTLIQGSAADQTKEAMIYLHERLLPGERIVGTVHDEISISHPPERKEAIAALFQEAANALPCDTPMIMDTKHGYNYAEASK